jgi:RimJ/RimL family protein N-acetyltransferase
VSALDGPDAPPRPPQGLGLALRPATREDAGRLFAWRNDPATRAASHDDSLLAWDRHLAWLERVLADPERMLWIAEQTGCALGTVRAERRKGAWLLSWTVAPEARGHGFGREMVREATACLAGPLRAEVKAGNAASRRIAEAAGLVLGTETDGILVYERR